MDEEKILDEVVEKTEEISSAADEALETSEETVKETIGAVEEAEKLPENPYENININAAPPVSKKTTVVLIAIIGILVAAIIVLTVMIVRNYRQNNPKDDTLSGEVISGSSTVKAEPTVAPVAIDYNVTVELGQYIGVEADAVPEEVTEEVIQDEIEYTLNEFAEEIDITDRPVQDGDVANIDYTGYIDDVPFDGGADTGFDLEIGSGMFIDGFESGLIGHNVGETVDVEVTFPEDYGVEELNGKPALFVVVINSITAYEYPELTDDFVKENFDYDTVEEYRASIREELEGYAMEDAEEAALSEVFEKIIDSSAFGGDIDAEIADYTEQTRQYYDQMANAYYGCDGATLFSAMYGITVEEYDQMLTEETAYSVKYGHVLDKIAELENITVTDEEYETEFEEMFFDYYGFTSKEEVLTQISQEEIDEMVNSTVKRSKAEQFVVDNAVINK